MILREHLKNEGQKYIIKKENISFRIWIIFGRGLIVWTPWAVDCEFHAHFLNCFVHFHINRKRIGCPAGPLF